MLEIIILAMVAVFLVTRLYLTFGTNTDSKQPEVYEKKSEENVVPKRKIVLEKRPLESVQKLCANENFTLENRIQSLLEKIKGFDAEVFLVSACRVFEMILHAFYTNEMPSVKGLVSKKIYDVLDKSITERKINGFSSEVEFICFDNVEIKDVRLLKNSVKIVVEFITQQINILRNAQGEVVCGDENFIQKITDVWTFERTLDAKDKNWILVSTKKHA